MSLPLSILFVHRDISEPFQPPAEDQEAARGPRPRRSLGATAGQGTAEDLPAPQSTDAVTCGNVRLGKAQSVRVPSRTPSR